MRRSWRRKLAAVKIMFHSIDNKTTTTTTTTTTNSKNSNLPISKQKSTTVSSRLLTTENPEQMRY